MGFVIGMDEAGYGPNLGPLVVTVTVWEVPGAPKSTTFWDQFEGLVVQRPPRSADEIQIADSKVVHDIAKGVGPLERGVLAAWGLMEEQQPTSLKAWWSQIATHPLLSSAGVPTHNEPWFLDGDLTVPQQTSLDEVTNLSRLWATRCAAQKIRLRAIRSDIVLTRRFNTLTTQHNSKGLALSGISMRLLQDVLPLTEGKPTLVWCDKHGGRNRYDELLQDIAGDTFISRLEEGTERSRYRIGKTDICFQTRAEAHLPVALASMVSKYWRESAMALFNNFWQRHQPELKPTKGYPQDAKRFKADIAVLQKELGIEELDLWRTR
ncbi:MAG: hypothetical protein V4719_20750 [Planctomycetota bacterium]